MTKQLTDFSQAKTVRFHEIDLLRALACLMVVAFHYLFRGALDGWSPEIPSVWLKDVCKYGYLGVHLFFMISGFVILLSSSKTTLPKFVASRISRLYPAFWVAVPMTWLIVYLFKEQPLQVSWQSMLINLTMVPHWFQVPYVDGAYWSLAVELHFYILVGLALRFGLMERAEWLFAAWLMLSVANFARPMYPVEFWLAAQWAPYFCIGASAYLIRTDGLTPPRVALFLVSYLLAVAYALKPSSLSRMGTGSILDAKIICGLVTAFAVIFILIAVGKLQFSYWKPISVAGMLTYPVYLLHEFIGYAFLTELNHRWALDWRLSVGLVFAAIVGLAWLLHTLVEEPLAPWLKRRIVHGLSQPLSAGAP